MKSGSSVSETTTRRWPTSAGCPYCGAPAGSLCQDDRGRETEIIFHSERVRAVNAIRLYDPEAGFRAGDALAKKHNRRESARLSAVLLFIILLSCWIGWHVY